MADVFMSYASQDLEKILPLVKAFEREGWSVFWDREIPLGSTWRQVLDRELSMARCIVVAWTEASVDRRWVLEEAEEGQSRGILIPVFMDRVGAPRGFREVQGALLADWKGNADHDEFVRLCGACREILGPGSAPPPEPSEPGNSERKKSGPRWASTLKWVAAALVLMVALGGSWLAYETSRTEADPQSTPVAEPAPTADVLTVAVQHQNACNRGSATDCQSLADLYSVGRGVAKDPLRAASFYQRACDGAIANACLHLGTLYEEGKAVAKDETKAATLYQQACDLEAENACERLRVLNERRSAEDKKPVQAEKRAQLTITVSPWGDVWIDGQYKSRAPQRLLLTPGQHTIGVGQGAAVKTRVIRLKPGEQKTVHFDLTN